MFQVFQVCCGAVKDINCTGAAVPLTLVCCACCFRIVEDVFLPKPKDQSGDDGDKEVEEFKRCVCVCVCVYTFVHVLCCVVHSACT